MNDAEQVIVFVAVVILMFTGVGYLVAEIKEFFKDRGDKK